MNGYAKLPDQTMLFSYEDYVLTFYPGVHLKELSDSYFTNDIMVPSDPPFIIGYDSKNIERYVFLVDHIPQGPFYQTTLSVDVYSYAVFHSDVSTISSISFRGRELNYFYPVNKGYDLSITDPFEGPYVSKVTTIPYNDTIESFVFSYKQKEITCTIGTYSTTRLAHTTPITLTSKMQFKFEETSSYIELLDLLHIARNFFTFIAYRKDVDISYAELYGKSKDKDLAHLGELHYNFKKTPESNQRILKKTVSYDLLKPHIREIFNNLSVEKIYVEHIPESFEDGNVITPDRFILIMAAFEWTVRDTYKIPPSTKTEAVKIDILDAIKDIPSKKSYSNKYRKKFDFFYKLISQIDTNLASKIQYALEDLHPILDPFIQQLYRWNHQKLDSYSQISNRLQSQRNNIAHGNLDKDLDANIVLDTIILEWVNYTMVFKNIGYSEKEIQKIINKIFNRNLYLPENET